MKDKRKYQMLDIQSRLILNLRDIGHVIRFLYEGRGSQKGILILLNEEGGMTQSELTERLGVQPGSASEVVRKLEAAGLIERTKSSADHRTVDISLTKEGKARAEEALQNRRIRHQEMFACLSEEEMNRFLYLAEKLNEDWEKRYSERNMNCDGHGHLKRHGRLKNKQDQEEENGICGNM